MKLSKNFTLKEFTKSDTAIRKNIKNEPSEEHLKNIQLLVDNVLQPLRDQVGPIKITSGYRSLALNMEINGSIRSQHSKGQAADIECSTMSNRELGDYIRNNLEFDQLIYEFIGDDPYDGWIHVSYSEHNRKSVLEAKKVNGKTVYKTI